MQINAQLFFSISHYLTFVYIKIHFFSFYSPISIYILFLFFNVLVCYILVCVSY